VSRGPIGGSAQSTHEASTCIHRMQKVLTQMNVQLANVIRTNDCACDSGGRARSEKTSGIKPFSDSGQSEEIAKSLEGNWRPKVLFALKQEMEMYDTYQRRIAECDRELEAHLKSFPVGPKQEEPPSEPRPGKKAQTTVFRPVVSFHRHYLTKPVRSSSFFV
jgi:transposase